MADLNRRVHPDCINAANPYHECAVNCLERIAQGNGRKDKKKPDNLRGLNEVRLSKQKDGERKVHPSCTKASNPFHECNENCFKRTAEADTRGIKKESGSKILEVSRSFGRKKKESESQPKPHPLLNNGPVEFQQKPHQLLDKSPVESPQKPHQSPVLSFVHPDKAPSPPSHFTSKEKVESEDDQSFSSSEQHSEGMYSRDHSFDKEQDQSSQTMPISMNGMPDHGKGPSKNSVNRLADETQNKQEEDEKHRASPALGDETRSFNFSGIGRSLEEEEEEVHPVISDSCVSVGKYRVRASVASILQSIFDKHGDIAAGCQLESVSMRAYYLECLCSVVQELQSISFKQVTKSQVKEMLAVLKDVESAKIDVVWLRYILNELLESIELSNQHQAIEAAKANCDRDLESTRRKLKSQMEELARKENDVADAQANVAETRARLTELELEYSQLDKIKSKVEKFSGKSLLDELL